MTIIEAIAREEGWDIPTSRCRRNRNPGNLRDGMFARAHGAIGNDDAFAIFPTDKVGFEAMRTLLVHKYSGLTVEQAINKYAPPVENDTATYLKNVCTWSGAKPKDIIDRHLVT